MYKNTFLLILLLLGAQVFANTGILSGVSAPEAVTCNLPAPQNLHTTVVGPTTATFEWDVVAGSDGYYFELRNAANNQLLDSGPLADESYVATVPPNVDEVNFTVWSVCPNGGGLGTGSSINVELGFVVIDDISAGYQGYRAVTPGNDFVIYGPDEPHEAYFKVTGTVNNASVETLFKVLKVGPDNVGSNGSDDYTSHVHHENNGTRWIFSNEDYIAPGIPKAPFNLPLTSVEADWVNVFYLTEPAAGSDLIKIEINKKTNGSGTSILHWTATQNAEGLRVVRMTIPSGGGTSNKPANNSGSGISATPDKNKQLQTDSDNKVVATEGILISPNPFSDLLFLQRSSEQSAAGSVRVFDLSGREVLSQSFGDELPTMVLPTAALQPGMYVVRYETPDAVKTFKVFKAN